jgi:hypothetical protein
MKKMKKIFLKTLMLFGLGAIIISCEAEDYTGYSQLTPTSPTTTISLDFSSPVTLVENDQVFNYTVTLSEVQIVDVKLHVEQVGGTADSDDYEMITLVTIPAGYTSAKGSIKILIDDVPEPTETLQIQIGDYRTANTALTPVTVDFNILNFEAGDLAMEMSWDMSETTTNNMGEEISPTDFADMVLNISTTPDLTGVVDAADGSGFETYVLSGDEPDGDYYLIASFYAANEEIMRELNLMLAFNQPGVITDDMYEYPSAISNASICDNNFYVMTKITKSGTTYTFENQSINNLAESNVSYSGTDAGYPSEVSTGVDCDGMTIAGLNAGWMLDFWGEIVIDAGIVYYTVDAAGVVTIENQFLYTTTYTGAVQPDYYIEGTGTYDAATGEITLQYSLIQGDWYLNEDYGDENGYFNAVLTPQ